MFVFFNGQSLLAQTDFVLTNEGDTIIGKVIKWNDQQLAANVTLEVNGEQKSFKAKDIKGFMALNRWYETARVNPSMVGSKKLMFIEKRISGKISLYSFANTDVFRGNNMNGDPLNPRTPTFVYSDIYFIKKAGDTEYQKLLGCGKLKKMTADCAAYTGKYGDKVKSEHFPYPEQIKFYNEVCR